MNLKEGDIKTNRFSPTGFYSSAINNECLKEMYRRSERQVEYKNLQEGEFDTEMVCGRSKRKFFVKSSDKVGVEEWVSAGYTEAIKTPDNTMIFITVDKDVQLKQDLKDCHGCLSQCKFSSWSQYTDNHSSGKLPDFRSFCIQKALQFAKKGINKDRQLWFAGNSAVRFATDPFYKNGFVPTIQQLVDGLMKGK